MIRSNAVGRALAAIGATLALATMAISCGSSSDDPVASTGSPTEQTEGRRLYDANCSACHGRNGQGGTGSRLTPGSLDADLEEVVLVIAEGSNRMPAFGDKLSAAEIDVLAAFVKDEL